MSVILIIVVIALILYCIVLYNRLVRLRMIIKNAWAQIGVQLKRRHDLIPNLVNAVKGYMKYEQETLNKVMEARAKAVSATSVPEASKAEGELSGVLSRLFALFENYPDLKANQNVMALQEELTTTENQIAYARQHYNDSVMQYNIALQVFPNNIIATVFNFKAEDTFLETTEVEKEVPKVDLNL